MPDEEIIALFWERSERAITVTQDKYGQALGSLARRFVNREDAEECVNDTYLSAWNHIPPTRPKYFFAWLAKICRNFACSRIAWNQAAKRNADMVALSEELAQCLPDHRQAEEVEIRELGRLLNTFLKNLSKEKRIVFLRRYWYGDSIREIATHRLCSESRVKAMLHRMRRELKEYLVKEGVAL